MTPDRTAPPPGRLPPAGGRVAVVHDWLTGMRGGEKVLEAILELYPGADLHTLVWVPGTVSPGIERRPIRTSFVNALPAASRLYRYYLPLFPLAVERFDFEGYDLVISSSHCAVKSVRRRAGAVHVCYCHSPMRYAWDRFDEYFGPGRVGRLPSALMKRVMDRLAAWDARTADRVDRFVANSRYVAGRIRRYYNRGSAVVYPPVDTEFYRPEPGIVRPASPRFLVVSALVPYKRVDLAIEACRRVGAPLTVVGRGPELGRLQALGGQSTEFLGWRSDEEVRELYRRSTAVLLPGVEDFGMVPVEAQACGTPVVALAEGGACESVVDGRTGILVHGSSADAFAEALDRIGRTDLDRGVIRASAERFSRERFLERFAAEVAEAHAEAAG